MESFHTHTFVTNCCIFFSDKWNHIGCLCNTSLFRLEFQCEDWLKHTKPWHKTSAGLFDFRIQNWVYSLYNRLLQSRSLLMNSQTPILKHCLNELKGGRRQFKSRDCLYVEVRPESRDLTSRSHTTRPRYTSTVSEQQGHKRKSSYVNQQHDAKRARRAVAQSTHLTTAALQSIQDEQKKPDDSNDFKKSWGGFSLDAMLTRNSGSMSWAVKMRHGPCRVIPTANEKEASAFYSQNSSLSSLTMLISKTYWRRIAL